MTTPEPLYHAYLLRLWQVRDRDKLVWRASLEDAHTGERRGFASLEMLLDFLRRQVGASAHVQEQANKRDELVGTGNDQGQA